MVGGGLSEPRLWRICRGWGRRGGSATGEECGMDYPISYQHGMLSSRSWAFFFFFFLFLFPLSLFGCPFVCFLEDIDVHQGTPGWVNKFRDGLSTWEFTCHSPFKLLHDIPCLSVSLHVWLGIVASEWCDPFLFEVLESTYIGTYVGMHALVVIANWPM